MRRSLLILLLLSLANALGAQELVLKDQFHVVPNDLTATQEKYQKLDRNGNPCALIMVGLVDKSATFHGDVVHAEYKQGEWWVYMIEGSQYLKIKTDDNLPKEITFPKLKKLTTYKVSFISNAPNKPNIPDPEPLLPFYENVNDEWMLGYLDDKGNIAIPATLKGVGSMFGGGTARVAYDGNWYYIDGKGHEVTSPSWSWSGLHLVKKNNKYGYADKTGRIVIQIKYDQASDFQCNRAIVIEGDEYGFITPKGNYIYKNSKDILKENSYLSGPFSDNYALIRINKNKYGFIDTNGTIQYGLGTYEDAHAFSEGLAAVKNKKGDWGYINTFGKLVIPYHNGSWGDSFSDGLAKRHGRFLLDLNNYYINKRGETILKTSLLTMFGFSEGLLVAGKRHGDDYRFGYIDHSGSVVIPFEFENARSFYKGFAIVKLYTPDYWVWINKRGEVLKDNYGRPYHSTPSDD